MSEQKLANQLEALLDEELAARGRTTEILNEQLEALQEDIDLLLGSTSGAQELLEQVASGRLSDATREAVLKSATLHERPQTRDLFERFVPPQRIVQIRETVSHALR